MTILPPAFRQHQHDEFLGHRDATAAADLSYLQQAQSFPALAIRPLPLPDDRSLVNIQCAADAQLFLDYYLHGLIDPIQPVSSQHRLHAVVKYSAISILLTLLFWTKTKHH